MKLIITNIELEEIQTLLKNIGISKVTWNIDNYIVANYKEAGSSTATQQESIPKKEEVVAAQSVEKVEEVKPTRTTRKFKPRKCKICGFDFTPNGARDQYCDKCKTLKNKEQITKEVAQSTKPAVKVPTTKKCPKCGKTKDLSEFDGGFYCKKCVEKVQNAPKLKLSPDEEIYKKIMNLPIVDRWEEINKLSFQQK